jgi:uncharacterized membrane protein
LLGASCFFAGGAVVGVLQLKAIRQERPSQVYAFLRRAPFGAALVGTGALLTLGFGIALAEHKGIGLSPAWIQASLGLWVAAMVLGAFGGRTARQARHLAKELVAEGDAPSPELCALVAARGPLYASYASFVLLLAIVVLMVWKPGGSEAMPAGTALPPAVQQRILSSYPKLAYMPTRLPNGVGYSRFDASYPNPGFHLIFEGTGGRELSFCAYPAATGAYPGTCTASQGVTVVTGNGHPIRVEGSSAAWRCVMDNTVLLQAGARTRGIDPADLETLVAYVAPIR